MCKRCLEKQAELRARREFEQKRLFLKKKLLSLLTTDVIKGSEWMRLKEMMLSPDKENLLVVESIITNLKEIAI